MSVLSRLNAWRRVLMPALTKNIGRFYANKKKAPIINLDVKHVLICRPNHRLGNILLITPLVQEVTSTFPNCKVDLITQGGLSPIVFKNYSQIDKLIQLPRKPFKELFKYCMVWLKIKNKKYDLAINAVSTSNSGKLLTLFSRSKYKVFEESENQNTLKNNHIAKNNITYLRHYIKDEKDSQDIAHSFPSLDLALDNFELENGKKIVNDLTKNEKPTISIFTHATGTKCYSESWWLSFYSKLKNAFSNYNIIEILPIENISKINFTAPSYYSKDIREMASFIANTSVFIGADSGIMHLASAAKATTIGLFSVTNQSMYEPYHNYSISINTNNTDQNESIALINSILKKKQGLD